MEKNLEAADHHFRIAGHLAKSRITGSRLRSIQAMAWDGAERIRLLKDAVRLALQGHYEDPDAAFAAECLAFHRLAAYIAQEGSDEQKQQLLPLLDDFIQRLQPHSPETARLSYAKALIIAPEHPEEAVTLLECAARRLWKESPCDAGPYLIFAARIAGDSGDIVKARGLCAQAEEFREALSQCESGREYVAMLDEVGSSYAA